jgi:hypothetical protein
MWHLKTKLGTFWIVSSQESDDRSANAGQEREQYYLGMDDDTIRAYGDAQEAIKDICNHTTGEIKWDVDTRIKVPADLALWQEGEPEEWRKN